MECLMERQVCAAAQLKLVTWSNLSFLHLSWTQIFNCRCSYADPSLNTAPPTNAWLRAGVSETARLLNHSATVEGEDPPAALLLIS